MDNRKNFNSLCIRENIIIIIEIGKDDYSSKNIIKGEIPYINYFSLQLYFKLSPKN